MNGIVARSEIYKLIQAAPNNKQKNIVLEMEKAPQLSLKMWIFHIKMMKMCLKILNFTIKAGSQVVLTGANGAGKSTIFKLLLKL